MSNLTAIAKSQFLGATTASTVIFFSMLILGFFAGNLIQQAISSGSPLVNFAAGGTFLVGAMAALIIKAGLEGRVRRTMALGALASMIVGTLAFVAML